MSGLPGNIAPADISASEVPDGFSLGPGAGGGGGGVSDQAAQKAAQRESILQQAMTPGKSVMQVFSIKARRLECFI